MSGAGFSLERVTPDAMIESVESLINHTRLLASKQATDTYLRALAVRNDAMLVTLDRRLSPVAVRNDTDHLLKIL